MTASPRLLLDSVWRHATDEGVEKGQVVRLLERLYRDHGIDARFGIFSVPVDRRLFSIANDLLKQMSVEELEALAVDEDTPADRELLTQVVARLKVRPEVGADTLMSFVTRTAPSFAAQLAARLTTVASSAFAVPSRRWDLINLFELDRERARSLVVGRLDAGMWREDDLLSVYVGAMIGSSGNRWHLDLDRMRSDLGSELADRVVAVVSSQRTPSAAILTEVPAGEDEPNIEQRRSLTVLLLSRVESIRDDDDE